MPKPSKQEARAARRARRHARRPTKQEAQAARRARRADRGKVPPEELAKILGLAPPPPPAEPIPEGRSARMAWFDEACHWTEYVGVDTPEGAFVVATADRHIGRGLFVKRARPEFRVLGITVMALEVLLGHEGVADRALVDVGANIGTTTVSALRSHAFASAVCLEPEEGNFRLLQTNLALNGLADRVRALPVGVSNEAGRATLVVHEENGGSSWIALDAQRLAAVEAARAETAHELAIEEPPPTRTVQIETATLDGLVADGVIDPAALGLIWIDTEGHEGHVLKGAAGVLEGGVPVVMEIDPVAFEQRGDAGLVRELTTAHYSHFIDVRRRKEMDGTPRLEVWPVSELADHAAKLGGIDRPQHTDVLLVRLDDRRLQRASSLAGEIKARRDRLRSEQPEDQGATKGSQRRRQSRGTSDSRSAPSSSDARSAS